MWPFGKSEPKFIRYQFNLSALTLEEKVDLLFDHLLISKFEHKLSESDSLVLKVNPDSISALKKKSYYAKINLQEGREE
jgi:hypothetical protein